MKRQLFVGRARDVACLVDSHEGEQTSIVLVSGELGIGKSALLEAFARIAEERGAWVARVDGRVSEIRSTLEERARELHLHALDEDRPLLLLDHFDVPAEEQRWFFDAYLPMVPARVLLVVAARRPLTRSGAHTGGLVTPFYRRIHVPPLADDEVLEYVQLRGIPCREHRRISSFVRGVPLLLVRASDLVSEIPTWATDHLEATVLATMANEFIAGCDADARRTSLAVLAIARTVVFETLAAVVGEETNELYAWLSTRSFVEPTPLGLRPHVAARAACLALLRKEHPTIFWSVVARLRAFYGGHLQSPSGAVGRWLSDRLFLEHQLSTRCYETLLEEEEVVLDDARPEDRDAIVAIADRLDGRSTGDWVRRWLDAGVGTCVVLRATDGAVGGYALSLDVRTSWPDAVALDPALVTVRSFLDSRDGGGTTDVTVVRSLLVATSSEQGLAVSGLLCSHIGDELVASAPARRSMVAITRTPHAWIEVAASLGFEHRQVASYHDGSMEHAVVVYDAMDPESPPVEGASLAERRATEDEPPDALLISSVADGPAKQEFGALLQARIAQLANNAGLTVREKQVLDLVVFGRNTVEIGKVLGISARTAKFHQARLLSKLGADSRMDIIRILF